MPSTTKNLAKSVSHEEGEDGEARLLLPPPLHQRIGDGAVAMVLESPRDFISGNKHVDIKLSRRFEQPPSHATPSPIIPAH